MSRPMMIYTVYISTHLCFIIGFICDLFVADRQYLKASLSYHAPQPLSLISLLLVVPRRYFQYGSFYQNVE